MAVYISFGTKTDKKSLSFACLFLDKSVPLCLVLLIITLECNIQNTLTFFQQQTLILCSKYENEMISNNHDNKKKTV